MLSSASRTVLHACSISGFNCTICFLRTLALSRYTKHQTNTYKAPKLQRALMPDAFEHKAGSVPCHLYTDICLTTVVTQQSC